MAHPVTVASVQFRNFKALSHYSVALEHMNILVGPNNCGKSTIIDAFRALEAAMRRARARHAESVAGPSGHAIGHLLDALPILTENVHTDYVETDTRVTFRLSNGNTLQLYFPPHGACTLIPETPRGAPRNPGAFRQQFPITVSVVPVLGPVEQEETLLTEETVRRGLFTHRASGHFRNYWRLNADAFAPFAALVQETWPGMQIHPPEIVDPGSNRLVMFCTENRIDRELCWAGFGFQVWCQMLTYIVQASAATLLVVDEPEIFLHAELQRQLLGILRDKGPDILLATHSTEIMGEADHSELMLVDKSRRSAERLNDVEGVQAALDVMGSIQNLTLTQLARNRRLLFIEGDKDMKILRRFARLLGQKELASGVGITTAQSEGFSSWERIKSLAWGFERALGTRLHIGAVFDHDYWPPEQTASIQKELQKYLEFAHIHRRKEVENYLLNPQVIERALKRAVADRARRTGDQVPTLPHIAKRLNAITNRLKRRVQAQYIARRTDYFKRGRVDAATRTQQAMRMFDAKWRDLSQRMELVPGKEVLRELRSFLQSACKVSLTDYRIIDEFRPEEVPADLRALLERLNQFRTGQTGRGEATLEGAPGAGSGSTAAFKRRPEFKTG
jgi:energy-coupling factor transporter ATP-binding protein EcfA2